MDKKCKNLMNVNFVSVLKGNGMTKGCNQRNIKKFCCLCYTPHRQESLLDGWHVGDKNGFLNDDSYFALSQKGIHITVNKKVYELYESKASTCELNEIKVFHCLWGVK